VLYGRVLCRIYAASRTYDSGSHINTAGTNEMEQTDSRLSMLQFLSPFCLAERSTAHTPAKSLDTGLSTHNEHLQSSYMRAGVDSINTKYKLRNGFMAYCKGFSVRPNVSSSVGLTCQDISPPNPSKAFVM
jgi:hypothetical protein